MKINFKHLSFIIPVVTIILFSSFVLMKKKSYSTKVKEFTEQVGYTPYQVLLIYTKAHEGFSHKWYKDGKVKGKQSYSIGYGINNQASSDLTDSIRMKYTYNGKHTNPKLASLAIKDWYEKHKNNVKSDDLYFRTAGLLQIYNRGSFKILGACCKSKTPGICGSKNKDIKESHENRRRFELALKNRNFAVVKNELKKCQDKLNSRNKI